MFIMSRKIAARSAENYPIIFFSIVGDLIKGDSAIVQDKASGNMKSQQFTVIAPRSSIYIIIIITLSSL